MQLLIVWQSDLPKEAAWYLARVQRCLGRAGRADRCCPFPAAVPGADDAERSPLAPWADRDRISADRHGDYSRLVAGAAGARARHRLDRRRGSAGLRRDLDRPAAARTHSGSASDACLNRHLPPARYEHADASPRAALIAFPAILAALLLSVLLVWWIYPGTTVDRRLPTGVPAYPSPRLQSDPAADMRKLREAKLARLNSFGWDDQAKGLGHIPINEAMRRVAASGIADWPK